MQAGGHNSYRDLHQSVSVSSITHSLASVVSSFIPPSYFAEFGVINRPELCLLPYGRDIAATPPSAAAHHPGSYDPDGPHSLNTGPAHGSLFAFCPPAHRFAVGGIIPLPPTGILVSSQKSSEATFHGSRRAGVLHYRVLPLLVRTMTSSSTNHGHGAL